MMVNKRIFRSFLYTFILMLAACSSQQDDDFNTTTSPTARSYHSTKPVVDINGVVPKFEPPSRIGNTDYDVLGQHYEVWNGIQKYDVEGTASWYGPGFHGKYTSNGELYDQEDISAAHKNLPLPSYVRVTNLDNGKRIIVRVNDRGPFHGDRVMDLSRGAASRLGIIRPGTAHVHLELVHPPKPDNANQLIAQSQARTIQLAVTNNLRKAHQVVGDVQNRYGVPPKIVTVNQVYKIHIGPLDKPKAEVLLAQLRKSGYSGAFFLN